MPGGIIDKEASIHISNVAHLDPQDGDAPRGSATSFSTMAARSALPSGPAKIIDR